MASAPKEVLMVAFAKDQPPQGKLALSLGYVRQLEEACEAGTRDANPHLCAAMRDRGRAIVAELDSLEEGALAGLWVLKPEERANLEDIRLRATAVVVRLGGGPANEEENFVVRYMRGASPEQLQVIDGLAALDRKYGNKPTA